MFPTSFGIPEKQKIPEKTWKKYPLESPPSTNLPNLRKAAEDLGNAGNAGHGAGSPSLPASTESRTPATSRSPRSPNDRRRDSNNDQELPGIKPVPRSRFSAGLFFFLKGKKVGKGYGLGILFGDMDGKLEVRLCFFDDSILG